MLKYFSILFIITSCAQSPEKTNPIKEKIKQDSLVLDSIEIREDVFHEEDLKEPLDTAKLNLSFVPSLSYVSSKAKVKRTIEELRQVLKYDSISLEAVGLVFTDLLLNEIVPHWYGTPWDYEGHTHIPNEGEIACGYFVSTTLRDVGVNINRYDLAKQAGLNEAKSIAFSNEIIKVIAPDGLSEMSYTEMQGRLIDGLYFVGLDSHVGYVYVKDNELYFLHSNYIETGVMIERAFDSEAFNSYRYYFLSLTHNKGLMWAWLNSADIKVVKD